MKNRKLVIAAMVLGLTAAVLGGCGHEHEFGEWEVTEPATCTEDGLEERKCKGCEETETQAITAKGHQLGEWEETTPATCQEDGIKSRVCSECDYKEEEVIAAAGHSFSNATLFEPKTCSVCGITEGEPLAKVVKTGETVEAEDHTFVIDETYYSSKLSETRGNHTNTFGTEGNYFIMKLSFTNNSTEALENYNTDRFSEIGLYYDGKYEYEGDYRLLIANEIVPLATENLYIYFNVPDAMKNDDSSELYASFKIDGTTYAVILQKGDGDSKGKEKDTKKKEKAKVESSVSVGDTRTDEENFSFVLSDIYYATEVSEKRGNHTSKFGSDGHYLILKLDFTNLTAESLENHSERISKIKLTYNDKYEYEGEFRLLIDEEIVPLANGNIFIFFDVPADLESKEGPLTATFTIDGTAFTADCR